MTTTDPSGRTGQRRPRRRWLVTLLVLLVSAGSAAMFALLVGALRSPAGGGFVTGDRVAVLELKGVILSSRAVVERLEAFREDDTVKAVVVRVESPGGGVAPSQEIYEELRRVDAEKPVVASFGSTAASGGYYVACGARKIVSNPGTLTGSIGVILESANYRQLLEKIGVSTTVVKSGEFKDIMSPTRDVTPAEQELLDELVQDVYRQFFDAIVESRGIAPEELRKVADGRVLSGVQALESKLVDQLGSLRVAVELAWQLAGKTGEPKVFYPRERDASLLDLILGNRAPARLLETALPPGPGLYFLAR